MSRRTVNVIWQARTSKCLDLLSPAMFSIADEGVDRSLCDPTGWAWFIETGKALHLHPFGISPTAFPSLQE
ncbi:MAG TPA: hypothetical protein VFN35_21975, partial [Ktedonobacteraceae bacterium]|nr:hypothetical protein [Ktedonobacteraceae bacterium]